MTLLTTHAIGWRRAIAGTQWPQSLGLAFAVGLFGVLLSLLSPFFLSTQNFLNIGRAISVNGIVAMVMTLLLISGSVDLSVSAVMAMAGIVVGKAMAAQLPLAIVLTLGLLFGIGAGYLNGVLVARVGINSIIVTIGTQFLWRGVAFLIAAGQEPLISSQAFSFIGQGNIGSVPVPLVILLGVFLGIYLLLHFTRLGVHLFAIGGDERSSRLTGLQVERLRTIGFVLIGASAALGGVVLTSLSGAILPYAAQGAELPILAAVILGGTALHGGRGSPVGTFLGLVLLGIIFNGLTLLNVSAHWQLVVHGVILLLAVTIDAVRSRRATR